MATVPGVTGSAGSDLCFEGLQPFQRLTSAWPVICRAEIAERRGTIAVIGMIYLVRARASFPSKELRSCRPHLYDCQLSMGCAGGGPSGALTALFLAKQNYQVKVGATPHCQLYITPEPCTSPENGAEQGFVVNMVPFWLCESQFKAPITTLPLDIWHINGFKVLFCWA